MLTGKVIEMEYWLWPTLHLVAGLITVLVSGGIRAVLANDLILKQQLLAIRRYQRRAPNLGTVDRVVFGFCARFWAAQTVSRSVSERAINVLVLVTAELA